MERIYENCKSWKRLRAKLVSNPDPRLHRLLAGQGDLTACRRAGLPVRPRDLLRHVSPIEWKNVILYGEIKIDPSKLKMRGS